MASGPFLILGPHLIVGIGLAAFPRLRVAVAAGPWAYTSVLGGLERFTWETSFQLSAKCLWPVSTCPRLQEHPRPLSPCHPPANESCRGGASVSQCPPSAVAHYLPPLPGHELQELQQRVKRFHHPKPCAFSDFVALASTLAHVPSGLCGGIVGFAF